MSFDGRKAPAKHHEISSTLPRISGKVLPGVGKYPCCGTYCPVWASSL